ncbi:MAG: hypothetical protein M3409_09210 [Gemmatimonadota bacterium]|nr:hypothetical protein [Gemmatimonadota bacterium]
MRWVRWTTSWSRLSSMEGTTAPILIGHEARTVCAARPGEVAPRGTRVEMEAAMEVEVEVGAPRLEAEAMSPVIRPRLSEGARMMGVL